MVLSPPPAVGGIYKANFLTAGGSTGSKKANLPNLYRLIRVLATWHAACLGKGTVCLCEVL